MTKVTTRIKARDLDLGDEFANGFGKILELRQTTGAMEMSTDVVRTIVLQNDTEVDVMRVAVTNYVKVEVALYFSSDAEDPGDRETMESCIDDDIPQWVEHVLSHSDLPHDIALIHSGSELFAKFDSIHVLWSETETKWDSIDPRKER